MRILSPWIRSPPGIASAFSLTRSTRPRFHQITCIHTVFVAFRSYNGHCITGKHLYVALLALMLARALFHDVVVSVTTTYYPRSVHTGFRMFWCRDDEGAGAKGTKHSHYKF